MTANLTPLLGLVLVIGLIPILAVVTTSFSKITIVLLIVRNALGIQQTPPNIVLFAIAIILSLQTMAPVLMQASSKIPLDAVDKMSVSELAGVSRQVAEPFRQFMIRNSTESSRNNLLQSVRRRSPTLAFQQSDLAVVVPAFLLDELTKAFEIGFILYIPFIVVDFIVGSVLVGLGLQMVSATTIATPLKVLLFVEVSGWTRLFDLLITSYR